MSGISPLKKLFGKKQQKLADLDLDEMKKERQSLERGRDRVGLQIDELEKQKSVLDAQGRSERQMRKQKILAEQLLQLETQIKQHTRNMDLYSKQLRILNGFIFLKENARVVQSSQLGAMISKMDTTDLERFIDQASLDGSFQLDKLNSLLRVMDESSELEKGTEEDRAVSSIVSRWQTEQASEAGPDAEAPSSDLEPSERER